MKKTIQHPFLLSMIMIAVVIGAGAGIVNHFFVLNLTTSSAGSVPVINSFNAYWTWYGSYGNLQLAWTATGDSASTITCYGSSSPGLSSFNGNLGAARGSVTGTRSITNAVGNKQYTLTLKCTTPAGSVSKTKTINTNVPVGGGCFTAGTLVTMADGSSKAIENVKVGDQVRSYSVTDGKVVVGTVEQTFFHQQNPEAILLINGTLQATANHPFLANGVWVRADALKVGDKLVSVGGGTITVTSVETTTLTAPVYNLEVSGQHDYFAGGVLVHNKAKVN